MSRKQPTLSNEGCRSGLAWAAEHATVRRSRAKDGPSPAAPCHRRWTARHCCRRTPVSPPSSHAPFCAATREAACWTVWKPTLLARVPQQRQEQQPPTAEHPQWRAPGEMQWTRRTKCHRAYHLCCGIG